MAMSKVAMEEDSLKVDIDLESVKQLIEQQDSKQKICNSPLYQWPIQNVSDNDNWKSNLFVIGRDAFICQLSLSCFEDSWNLKLELERLTKDGSKQEEETFPSFQHFICKAKLCYSKDIIQEMFALSSNAFIPDAKKNVMHFHFTCTCTRHINYTAYHVNKVLLELYEEPSTSSVYVSPLKNAVVGKIEQFSAKRSLVSKNEMLLVSPKFDFGSADQKMIVRFWHAQPYTWETNGVWASLHVISEKEAQVGPPFVLKVSFTIFNQRENGSDIIKKIVLPSEGSKCEYPILLAFESDLQSLGYLENDTLYYRVVVEPFTFKLPDETAKNSK